MSLARQESGLVEEPRDSVHLDEVLDIVLFIKALLRNLELLVAVQMPLTLAFAARYEAAADCFEAVD